LSTCITVRFSESIFESEEHTYEMEYEQPKDDGQHVKVGDISNLIHKHSFTKTDVFEYSMGKNNVMQFIPPVKATFLTFWSWMWKLKERGLIEVKIL